MLNKKFLLFASVIMATAGDKETSTPQPDIVITNHPNYKDDIEKIVTEFKDIILIEIKKDTLSDDEKAKACGLFKLLCGYFYYAFEEQFLEKNIDNDIKLDDIFNKKNLKDQADFESCISDEHYKLINNLSYLDADSDYFEDCAKKFLAGCAAACDEFINEGDNNVE